MQPDDVVWKAVDVFATQNGSWEYKATDQYGIGLAERARYLRSPDDPYCCDDFGAERHILTVAINKDGIPYERAGFVLSSDGPEWLQRPFDPNHVTIGTGKAGHGWYNLPMGDGSAFSPPAHGPWSVAKIALKGASDIVIGFGLPDRWHVAGYGVFMSFTWAEYRGLTGTLEENLIAEAERRQVIQFNADASLQKRIFADGFVPNSGEFRHTKDGATYIAQRAEHLRTREVRVYYAPVADYNQVGYFVRPRNGAQ